MLGETVIVDIGADFRTDTAKPDNALDQFLDGAANAVFEGQTHFLGTLAGKGAVLVIGSPGQQLAPAVEDGNVLRFHVRNGGGNKMLDRQNLFTAKAAGPLDLEHDGCARLAALAAEEFALRQHQVNTGAAHIVHCADGSSKLAFERADQIYVLNKIGGSEAIGLVEDFVSHGPAARHALLGEGHAEFQDFVAGDKNLLASSLQFVLNIAGFEFFDDGTAVGGIEVAIKQ